MPEQVEPARKTAEAILGGKTRKPREGLRAPTEPP
jgi:hypothetical protein